MVFGKRRKCSSLIGNTIAISDDQSTSTQLHRSSLFIQLPVLKIGQDTNLQYLRIRSPQFDVVSASNMNGFKDENSLYLFLGADVLSGSSLNPVHHPRTHARFAKQGLACKLNFSKDVKLNGLHGISKGIWFYTIQGLFRVVFEFHDRRMQLYCMNSLQELWLASFIDKMVPESTVVVFETPLSNTDRLPSPNKFIEEHTCSKKQKLTDSTNVQASIPNRTEASASRICKFTCHKDNVEGYNYMSNGHVTTEGKDVKTVGCSVKSLGAFTSLHDEETGINKLLQEITKKVHILDDDEVSSLPQYPLQLFLACLHRVKSVPSVAQFESMLWSICKWLGAHFHGLIPNILEKADTFKSRHIDSIDNLPCAEEVIQMIFPSAMKILLTNWMGIVENSKWNDQVHECTSVFSNVHRLKSIEGAGDARCDQQNSNLYPLIQLILEFSNQVLISGMAHVLFPRLVHEEQ